VTARRAEQEVYAFLKAMDRLQRYVAKLHQEDMPVDLADFGAASRAFLALLDPFMQRHRQIHKLRRGLGGVSILRETVKLLEARVPLSEEEEAEVAELRAGLAQGERLVPEIKAALAILVAARPIDTAELERMLPAARRPIKRRKK
jgi:hypothetical protein